MNEKNNQEKLFEIIVPVGDLPGLHDGEALYDDCPLCRELKLRIALGEVEPVSFNVEENDGCE